MALKPGKRDVQRVADLLEGDFDSAEEAAAAVLDLAWQLYEAKGKFTVVGQMYYSPTGGWLDHRDAQASKIALGWYGTEKQAQTAAESLVFSRPTGEEFRAWVLPVFHGTPSQYFTQRNEERKAEELKENGSKHPTFKELVRREAWLKENPDILEIPADFMADEPEMCPQCNQEIKEAS